MADHAAHGHEEPAHEGGHAHPPARCMSVSPSLLIIITLVEVVIWYIPTVRPALVPALLVLSLAKFLMVVGFFMHLRFDSRLYRFMFAAGLVVTLGVYLALLAMLWTRGFGSAPDHRERRERWRRTAAALLPLPRLTSRSRARAIRGPLLHAGGVDPTGWLWSDWNIEPTIAIGLLALVTGYLFLTRTSSFSLQKASFIAGAVVLFVALGPPLDDWSDHYLLLAHMVQHLLLIMLAAPLLLYGTPAWVLEPLTRNRITNTIGYWLTRPVIAYTVANAVFVLWHVPMFYEMALRSQPVHVFEHATMLGTALLAWWPTWARCRSGPSGPAAAQPLLLRHDPAGHRGGAFITFADPGLYAPYDTAQRIFGIDLATDQQAAGLLMWVALGTIYLLLITFSFFRWVSREEAADQEAAAQTGATVTTASVPGDHGARVSSTS